MDVVKFSFDSIENLSIFKQNPKLLLRLKSNTSEDNFYETHQLYKLINFRCSSNDLHDESIDLLYNGITYFWSKAQLHCTFDLSKVFIEALKKSKKTNCDQEMVKRIKVIHAALKDGAEERHEFTIAILKWSGELFVDKLNKLKSKQNELNTDNNFRNELNLTLYQKTFGHVEIHKEFALTLWREKNYVKARYHFLHSLDGVDFALMLIECHLSYGFPAEADLFLAQAVLQYLTVRNWLTAQEFYDAYLANHPYSKNNDFNNSALINFLKFLLISIKQNNLKLFKVLIDLYKPSLGRDESFPDYIDRIGQYFFNLKPNKPVKENMFNNILRMLTSGGESSGQAATSSRLVNDEASDDGWDSSKEDIEDNEVLD